MQFCISSLLKRIRACKLGREWRARRPRHRATPCAATSGKGTEEKGTLTTSVGRAELRRPGWSAEAEAGPCHRAGGRSRPTTHTDARAPTPSARSVVGASSSTTCEIRRELSHRRRRGSTEEEMRLHLPIPVGAGAMRRKEKTLYTLCNQ
jgi:hypothetical protein